MQRNLATKIRAKWESGLTTVQLKQDPPVLNICLNVGFALHNIPIVFKNISYTDLHLKFILFPSNYKVQHIIY